MTQPEIVPIFWGNQWATNNGSTQSTTSRAETLAYLQALANGAYFAALSQYGAGGGIGPTRISAMAPSDPTPTTFTPYNQQQSYAAVQAEINSLISSKRIPPPSQYADILYVVFDPPDGSFRAPGFTNDYNCGAGPSAICPQGVYSSTQSYNYALVAGGDFAGLSHELVEAIAGNVLVTNCTGGFLKQIGDICECDTQNTLFSKTEFYSATAAYWSAADQACVVPAGWPDMWQYNRDQNQWTQIWTFGPIQQAFTSGQSPAGFPNLVVQGTTGIFANSLWQYLGTPGDWNPIDAPRAMWAMDGYDNITALAQDGSAIEVGYLGSGGPGWQNIGLPAGLSTGLVNGNTAVATDALGQPYYWNRTPGCSGAGCWTKFGGPGDQFVGVGGDVAAIGWDHKTVFTGFPGSTPNWTYQRGPTWKLYGNPGSDTLLAMDMAASKNMWAMSFYDEPGIWFQQGGPANDFAIGGGGPFATIWGLDTPRNGLFEDETYPLITNPGWSQINGNTGKILGGGKLSNNDVVLYATSCANPKTCVVY